jgi:hypothetical protein
MLLLEPYSGDSTSDRHKGCFPGEGAFELHYAR